MAIRNEILIDRHGFVLFTFCANSEQHDSLHLANFLVVAVLFVFMFISLPIAKGVLNLCE